MKEGDRWEDGDKCSKEDKRERKRERDRMKSNDFSFTKRAGTEGTRRGRPQGDAEGDEDRGGKKQGG